MSEHTRCELKEHRSSVHADAAPRDLASRTRAAALRATVRDPKVDRAWRSKVVCSFNLLAWLLLLLVHAATPAWCWNGSRRASKAPAARCAASEQLAWSWRVLLDTVQPPRPADWPAPCPSLGSQRVGAACCTVAASELCVMVVRRVWQLIAGRHRYRARARLWCNGDRSVVR